MKPSLQDQTRAWLKFEVSQMQDQSSGLKIYISPPPLAPCKQTALAAVGGRELDLLQDRWKGEGLAGLPAQLIPL